MIAHRESLGQVLSAQADEVLARPGTWDRVRWDRALRDRVLLRNRLTASDFGEAVAARFGVGFDPGDLDALLSVNAEIMAAGVNGATEDALQAALVAEDPDFAVLAAMTALLGHRLDRYARSTVTLASNFGSITGARQGGAHRKVWVVTSRDPRSSHAALNGESAELGESFSNGLQWPGDPSGGAEEAANCQCAIDFEG